MKKNLIAASAFVAAGLISATAAQAAVLSGTGINIATATAFAVAPDHGHILVFPYYTAQNGLASSFGLTNHDMVNGKMVKVRFRSAGNSDDVFDFTLFLSPGDMWNGMVSKDANGVAQLTASDNSCTLPAGVGKAGNSTFKTLRVGPSGKDATLEGYVEVISMADIAPTTAAFAAAKHVGGVAPCTAGSLGAASSATTNDAAESVGLRTSTGMISGTWTMINVDQGMSYSGDAVALKANGRANMLLSKQTNEFARNSRVALETADALFVPTTSAAGVVGPVLQTLEFDYPDLSTPMLVGGTPQTQIDDIKALLEQRIVANQHVTLPVLAATTDWVLTQPTRRYEVAIDYATAAANAANPSFLSKEIRVFNDNATTYTAANTSVQTVDGQPVVCTRLGVGPLTVYDTEEREAASGAAVVVSPAGPGGLVTLCGEASVASFNNTGNSTLGAKIARQNWSSDFSQGWARLSLRGPDATTGFDRYPNGLPVVGAAFVNFVNGNVAGSLANYGVSYGHIFTK